MSIQTWLPSTFNPTQNCKPKFKAFSGAETWGAGGIVPLKKLDGGDGGAFIPPQYLENVLQIYNVKKIRMKQKEDKTNVTVIDIQALSYSHILCNTV